MSDTTIFDDMRAFDEKYGFNKVEMTAKFLAFRVRFLIEELFEGIEALENGDAEKFVDAMVDLIVVATGTLTIAKVDGQLAWDEVKRANMSKVRAINPTRSGSDGADLIKPEGWEAPSHVDNIGAFSSLSSSEFSDHFPHSITVLFENMKLQLKKNHDYDSDGSGIQRADYFIHGLDSFEYEINKKWLRIRSVLNLMRNGETTLNESLEDSIQDQISYLTFMLAWSRNKLEGQTYSRDLFNKPI